MKKKRLYKIENALFFLQSQPLTKLESNPPKFKSQNNESHLVVEQVQVNLVVISLGQPQHQPLHCVILLSAAKNNTRSKINLEQSA